MFIVTNRISRLGHERILSRTEINDPFLLPISLWLYEERSPGRRWSKMIN